jgi:Alkylmercury lyase
MEIERELRRLSDILPLESKQRELAPELVELYRAILRSFVERGLPLNNDEIGQLVPDQITSKVLATLAAKDLVVLDDRKERVIGAYPFTTESTCHKVVISGRQTHAMCAVDALSISPMFDTEVIIESRCHVSATPIRIRQRQMTILETQPSDVHVGIRWQSTRGCAAHSLCLEMVFLRDSETAAVWLTEDHDNRITFTLAEAIEFGARFFMPLIGRNPTISDRFARAANG